MAKPVGSLSVMAGLGTVILVVIALYFGRPVLMPLALAVLLSFLLSPVAEWLHRLGVGRKTSVVFLVILAFLVFGAGAYGIGSQLSALAYQLPAYKDNIREKVLALREAGKDSPIERLQETVREIQGELKKSEKETNRTARAEAETGAAAPAAAGEDEEAEGEEEVEPVPVVVRGGTGWELPTALGPLLELLATLALVIVLVIFMLLRRQELRNRFIILCGYSRVPTTTQALDEAGERISRYLLMQTTINSMFGVAVGIGLYFIGVPYALLWAFLAGALRFIPYVGPWLGAALPVLMSLAVFPGWVPPLLVIGLILVLELTTNMILEPLLYGQTAGVSEVALLVAVAFWTWVWGPIGLALATPLTVCLVVLGKYVPGLSVIQTLLGDEPIMKPQQVFYQRLLAMDEAEALEIAAQFRKGHEAPELYDELLTPALVAARRDLTERKLAKEHLHFIRNTMLKVLARESTVELETTEDPEIRDENDRNGLVLAIPAEDPLDELALLMLKISMPAQRVEVIPAKPLTGEMIDLIGKVNPSAVCIGAIAPGSTLELRHLCKRVQLRFPELRMVVGRLGMKNEKRIRALGSVLGTNITTSLSQTKSLLQQLLQLKKEEPGAVRPRETDLQMVEQN